MSRITRFGAGLLAVLLLAFAAAPAVAQEANEYRQFLDLDSRKVVWLIAQVKLFFAAFVLAARMPASTVWPTSSPAC
jgi:hypothetical protein